MAVIVKPVQLAKEFKQFIDFPYQHYKDNPNWIAPLRMEVHKLFNPRKNPFHDHAIIQNFVAIDENQQTVGRICAINNKLHEEIYQDSVGFFGFYESINDPKVSSALFEAATQWLKFQGKKHIRGPLNFDINGEVGCLINAFEQKPYILMPYNHSFYPQLIETAGFTKIKDVFAWKLTQDSYESALPQKMFAVIDKMARARKITYQPLDMRRLDEHAEFLKSIFREAWSDNWGALPVSDAEWAATIKDFKQIVDPDLVIIGLIDNKPVGILVLLPNMNEVTDHIRDGKLFPFGIFKVLKYQRKIKTARMALLGILKEYRSSGILPGFFKELTHVVPKKGINELEFSWTLKDNEELNKVLAKMSAQHNKTYRIYQKSIFN